MRQYKIDPHNVLFDAGGGGKQHVDRLRQQGYNVRSVAFGASAVPEMRRGMKTFEERKHGEEDRYVYKRKRDEMYGLLRRRLDPSEGEVFALSRRFHVLRRQLEPIPLQYDPEGRLELPPKNRRPDQKDKSKVTLVDLIGHSPDEADALVLAVYGLDKKSPQRTAGVVA